MNSKVHGLGDLAQSVGTSIEGEFDYKKTSKRFVLFLDTPDYTLRANDLLLRQRVKRKKNKTEYTLKCRTEDRYIAAHKDVGTAANLKSSEKFAEDIGVPFVSRFSHSATACFDNDSAGKTMPETIGVASKIFPGPKTMIFSEDFRTCF
jgi:hypothetical protein